MISVLKTFLNWSTEKKYNRLSDYKKFSAKEREKEVIYLTVDELFKLYHHEFDSVKLEHVRDTFCFACFTGLRFGDIKALTSQHIQNGYILKSIEKTKQVNDKLPINKFAQQILDKYQDTIHYPLPVISQQKYNDYIKKCCEEAKIETEITITEYRGSEIKHITKPKHKFITSHVARKTFITNSLILGMKEVVVKSISGHKKEANFRKYVKIAEDVKKNEVDSTWNLIENERTGKNR